MKKMKRYTQAKVMKNNEIKDENSSEDNKE